MRVNFKVNSKTVIKVDWYNLKKIKVIINIRNCLKPENVVQTGSQFKKSENYLMGNISKIYLKYNKLIFTHNHFSSTNGASLFLK